jgi:hypothetical protein
MNGKAFHSTRRQERSKFRQVFPAEFPFFNASIQRNKKFDGNLGKALGYF